MARCGFACFASTAVILALVAAGWRAVVLTPISFKPVDLTGKVAIVTGATNGIGLETAVALASWNASVVLPVRNVAKGERVKKEILARLPQGSTGAITLMQCDLASFASVRKFAAEFIANRHEFHMLVLNAGMNEVNNLRITEDGNEMTYQVNHLSHFLMTRLLVDTPAKRVEPLRVVHVSSFMHYLGSLDEVAYSKENRNADKATADLVNSYSTTKMMNILFSNKLQRQLGSSVTSIAISPGLVVSGLDSHMPPPLGDFLLWLRKQIARNTDDGAVTQVTAATLPELRNAGGQYLEDRCIDNLCRSCVFCNAQGGVQPKAPTLSIEKQDWLWTTGSAIVGLDA